MKKALLIAILFAACGLAQAQCGAGGVGAFGGVGQFQCGLGIVVVGLENTYCTKGAAPEMTEGTPLWGATDDLATLPQKCMYTGSDATPSNGNVYTPATTTTFANVLLSANGGTGVNADGTAGGTRHLSCSDIIELTAGVTYTGTFTIPAIACDGQHWITIRSAPVRTDPLFPGEGVRATPCEIGLTNDDAHNLGVRQVVGYPDFVCATPAVRMAQIVTGTTNQPAITFAAGANRYRFIGIEITKVAEIKMGGAGLVELAPDKFTLGANHIIWDRVVIHGQPWTNTATKNAESQAGIKAKNSQWIALINYWNYDTYCNASCIDSQGFNGGTGAYQDGPFKIYNGLLASAGESWIFGGGGVGPGTPNTANSEIRSNHFFKPLTWVVPINTCANFNGVVPKNLGELKNSVFALIEGNVFENSWQGCQSDQIGYGMLLDPVSQNNAQGMAVTFNGTAIVTAADSNSFTHDTGNTPQSGNPIDAADCPPGGCILEISDGNRQNIDNGLTYRFCNSANGCDQNGVPNLKCGGGANVGLACTTDAQCPGTTGNPQSFCAPTTSARLTTVVPAGTAVQVNSCVPGDCPSCRNKNVTFRFNELYNVTNGLEINGGTSSHCHDQDAGLSNFSIHDNNLHGLSREMSNGNDPYTGSTAFNLSSNVLPPGVVSFVGIRHNTVAVETASQSAVGGFGNQVDRTNIQYLQGIAITDNVVPGAWGVSGGSGFNVTKGINGQAGLAYTYATDACQRYFTVEIPSGTVPAKNPDGTPFIIPQDFTFAGLPGGGTNFLISLNGQYTAITLVTATSFHVTATVKAGDTIVVRDLGDCDYTFASNVIGVGTSGIPGLAPAFYGSGKSQFPYPNLIGGLPSGYFCGPGGTLSCVLDETTPGTFISNFISWLTGRDGDYRISASSPYYNTASDALTRPATGQSPGADFTLLAAKTAGVRTATKFPALTLTTSTLSATAGQAYNAQLQAGFGASQFWDGYKSWFQELNNVLCNGACGALNNGSSHSGIVISRSGIVNGPLAILNVSRTGCPTACLSNYTVTQTITGGAWEVGQTVSMATFADCTVAPCTTENTQDSSFNGICTVTALATSGFSCRQAGDISGTNSNKKSHSPYSPKTCGLGGATFCDSTASFAPITAGTYTFWVGVRDGAFQTVRGQITATVAPGSGNTPETLRPTADSDAGAGAFGCGTGTSHVSQPLPNSYDAAGLTTSSTLLGGGTNTASRDSTRLVNNWQSTGFTYTALTLNINASFPGADPANAPASACVKYSTNGGTSYTAIHCDDSVGAPQQTYTVTLAPTQNLSQLRVGVCAFGGQGSIPLNTLPGVDSVTIYDISTVGIH